MRRDLLKRKWIIRKRGKLHSWLETWTSWLECVGLFHRFTGWLCFLGGMSSIIQITSWNQQSKSNHILVLSTFHFFFMVLFNEWMYYSRLVFEGSVGIVLIKVPKIWSKSGSKWSVRVGTRISVSWVKLISRVPHVCRRASLASPCRMWRRWWGWGPILRKSLRQFLHVLWASLSGTGLIQGGQV